MRKGIAKLVNGVLRYDLSKIIGTSYGNFWFTNTSKIRYRLLKGSRNCKKSVTCAYETVFKIISDPNRNILWVRAQDVDNRNSCFSAICRAITDLGLESYFKTTTQPLMITYIPTGQQILFRGMSNPTSLNSISFVHGYLSDVYLEECYEITSYDAFIKLDQSVRSGMEYDEEGNLVEVEKPQQITMLFNAWSDVTWLYSEFFKGRLEDNINDILAKKYIDYIDYNFVGPGGTGLYLSTLSYLCNEFRNKQQVDVAAEEMRVKNPDYWATLYLGCWGSATSTTYPEFKKDNIITAQEVRNNYVFTDFAIGIDTGLSAGDGSKIKVLKEQNVENRIKSATVVTLGGITPNYEKIIAIDEYYHSNDTAFNTTNTDSRDNLGLPELADQVIKTIIKWRKKYAEDRNANNANRRDILMKGNIYVYVDSADVGGRQVFEMKANEYGLTNVYFVPATKTSIQGRIDFERLMLSYGDLLISENCPNLIREFKNSRRDPKSGARENLDDHCLNSFEYFLAPFRNYFTRWKVNFEGKKQ